MFYSDFFQAWAWASGAAILDHVEFQSVEVVPSNFANSSLDFAPEVAPGTYKSERMEGVTFGIEWLCSRTTTELYLAGFPVLNPEAIGPVLLDDSVTIIEKWTFQPAAGAPFTDRTPDPTPIGSPVPLSVPSTGIEGGTYQIPSLRRPSQLTRRELVRLPMAVYAIEVDPESRYLVILAPDDGGLYQLDLATFTGTPYLAVSSATYPEIAQAQSLRKARFQDGAKCYVLGYVGGAVLVRDVDNDGILETVEVISDDDWDQLYSDDSQWQENYENYALK